ncbi:MAG: hypothetical protein U0223_03435 [Nitrospira sp.]
MAWLKRHLAKTPQPLLTTPWILDLDPTMMCLYGKLQMTVDGYTPKNPERPSHHPHNTLLTDTRLAVDVLSDIETASLHGIPKILA